MASRGYSLLFGIIFICVILAVVFHIEPRHDISAQGTQLSPASVSTSTSIGYESSSTNVLTPTSTQSYPASSTHGTKNPIVLSTSSPMAITKARPLPSSATASSSVQANKAQPPEGPQSPYSYSPSSFSDVNTTARGALVNILCMPRGGGSLNPISGSGVIIDPRGVILTNAHVAQYVLLSEASAIDLSCSIRSGSPATAHWMAQVLYIPRIWVDKYASEINTSHPTGTGEHDFALLYITKSLDGTPLPSQFPFLALDTRAFIAITPDVVLGVGYAAEFVGGMQTENALYPLSSIGPIGEMLTFASTTADILSLGGVVEAQSGSSGGPVVNAWNRVVGVITTTSEGATTGARNLRAISTSYIDRDFAAQTGSSLTEFLSGDLTAKQSDFDSTKRESLLKKYIAILSQ